MPTDTAAPWECGRCGERFADHEEAQGHADTCDRPTMRPATATNDLPRCPKCGAFMSEKDDPDGPIFYCIRCGYYELS